MMWSASVDSVAMPQHRHHTHRGSRNRTASLVASHSAVRYNGLDCAADPPKLFFSEPSSGLRSALPLLAAIQGLFLPRRLRSMPQEYDGLCVWRHGEQHRAKFISCCPPIRSRNPKVAKGCARFPPLTGWPQIIFFKSISPSLQEFLQPLLILAFSAVTKR